MSVVDQHSIITQVSRDDDQLNTYRQASASINSTSNGTAVQQRQKQGGLWGMLCCVRQGDQPPGQLRTAFQNEAPPSPRMVPNSDGKYLLKMQRSGEEHKKCVVIDLDETLVHSSFKPVSNADFIVPVEIDGVIHQVYVLKRPFVDEFLKRMGELFECVLFTASLSKYADPVTDLLDKNGTFHTRLFREACVFHRGSYVKDLSRLGRDLRKTCIIDNSPASYIFHPDNAIPVTSWFDDPNDTELLDLIPFFEALDRVDNILTVLAQNPSLRQSGDPNDEEEGHQL